MRHATIPLLLLAALTIYMALTGPHRSFPQTEAPDDVRDNLRAGQSQEGRDIRRQLEPEQRKDSSAADAATAERPTPEE